MRETQVHLSELIAPSFYDAHLEIKNDKFDEYWFRGGRGSTKSTFISIEILYGLIRDPEANALVLRRYQNELRDTVYGQFEWSIIKMGLEDKFKFLVAPMQIIYEPTGQKIVFKAADNPKKLKSINLGRGYIKYLWMEELDQFNGMSEVRNIIQSTFRGVEHKRVSFYSYNPPKSARFWANHEAAIPKNKRRIHNSDYLSVPESWLGSRFITDAEHLRDTNYIAYQHEYLGLEVGTGLEVFNNIKFEKLSDIDIRRLDNFRQGLDFGYAVDPLCFERMAYNRKKRKLVIFKEISGLNLFNRVFYDQVKPMALERTVGDSAEPKSIDELRSYGMKIVGAKKGPGSIESGIKFLQDMEKIIIDPERCPLAAREFINYSLETDRSGEVKHKFPDKDNHSIDAVRYALEDDIPKPDRAPQLPISGFTYGAVGSGTRV